MRKIQLLQQPLLIAGLFCLLSCSHTPSPFTQWSVYGGGKEGMHYSGLTQIDTGNVSRLRVAWVFHTGDADSANHSQIQCNPIIVNGILYGTSPQLKLFALDATSGKRLWVFNPMDSINGSKQAFFVLNNCRGITYWEDGPGDKRIYYTAGSYLYAIDASTGNPVPEFGDKGHIDLHDGLGRDVKDLFVTATSPPVTYRDLLIVGTRVDEGPAAAPGHIRAFDVKSGKMKWIFHTIPQPGEEGYQTWDDPEAWKHIGGANTWSGFTLDEKRGLLFAPTGSASFDFYGGKRKGQDLYANCLIALDAGTGKRRWHFQFVHHDVWDKDLPTPPVLVTVTRNGKPVDAVAQATKTGMIYVLERETGKPLFPVKEVRVDTAGAMPGESLWPTQPIPEWPAPFVRQTLTQEDINPWLPDSSVAKLKKELAGYRYGNMFLPPGKHTSVIFPGYDGGAEWGGPAFDPQTGILYVNANEMAWLLTLQEAGNTKPRRETFLQAGQRLYAQHCISCHGPDRKGSGNYPSITEAGRKYGLDSFLYLLNSGRRMMPSFQRLSESEKKAIASFVLDRRQDQGAEFVAPTQPQDAYRNLPYTMTGYYKFLSPEGYPAIRPPWGTLTAINLNDGRKLWQLPLGEYPELTAKGVPPTGTENYGGPVVTSSGLVFIAATRDGRMRAYNKRTGKLLWEYQLPAAGFATPAVYQAGGKEFVVIACGGGKLGTASADAYVAFSLPD